MLDASQVFTFSLVATLQLRQRSAANFSPMSIGYGDDGSSRRVRSQARLCAARLREK